MLVSCLSLKSFNFSKTILLPGRRFILRKFTCEGRERSKMAVTR